MEMKREEKKEQLRSSRTGRPVMLRFMGSQRLGHDWATELNWEQGCLLRAVYCVCSVLVWLVLFSCIAHGSCRIKVIKWNKSKGEEKMMILECYFWTTCLCRMDIEIEPPSVGLSYWVNCGTHKVWGMLS